MSSEMNNGDGDKEEGDAGSGHVWFASWFVLWIFTIGFSHLSFGQGVFAFVAWPYYLGQAVARAVGS